VPYEPEKQIQNDAPRGEVREIRDTDRLPFMGDPGRISLESVVGIRLRRAGEVGSEREADREGTTLGDDDGASTEEGDPGEIETEEVEEE